MQAQHISGTLDTRDLVRSLGGPAAVARQLGVSGQAVSNWYREGIPQKHHLRLWGLAQAAGLAWRPPGADVLKPPAAPGPVSRAA